ncbi:G-type lectin S-receptor-like serine/threonine-protein kinase SD1-13 [Silene latifolia]|uniref:G-type lectin S-receptor-like serine/threonine-protein kinase SD1-13 n=1 Tax=Silene latifolia TaxID=37657 RepID=UPI003D786635
MQETIKITHVNSNLDSTRWYTSKEKQNQFIFCQHQKLKPMSSLKVLLFLSFLNVICNASDSINTTTFLKNEESIVSSNGTFRLAFFSPPNTTNRYVGIYYNNLPTMKAVWVANRNNPLNDSSGSFQISKDGNLQVLNGQKHILWSSNVTNFQVATNATNVSKAQLLDSGNLVLLSSDNNIIWQSFDHPTNILLPDMSLVYNKATGKHSTIQAWKNPSDPSEGRFVSGLGPIVPPEVFIWDMGRLYYRSGPWNGFLYLGIDVKAPNSQTHGITIQIDGHGNTSLEYSAPSFPLTNYELSYQGTVGQQSWDDTKGDWNELLQAPSNECDVYGRCGEYGSCNSLSSPICNCLKGFEPKNSQEWSTGNWSSGCTRKTKLLCGIQGAKEDVFFSLPNVKPPANTNEPQGVDQNACRSQCLSNCSCIAYAFDIGLGCMTWSGNLTDIQQFSSNGVDLYLRLAHSELGNNNKRLKIIVPVTAISGAATLVAIVYFLCRRKAKQGDNSISKPMDIANIMTGKLSNLIFFLYLDRFEELPLFTLEQLAVATSNFQDSNKLGQGGFGAVYKGTLDDGQVVAIKRLSGTSTQGVQEFMNEVLLISKLQHRNLVKLLGCCVERLERMLIYDYMPNKSLDAFLFDHQKKGILDWKKRYTIIEGICRGLLYLHRDSRLKIIHRDLKSGNILLDENLNPKISDFGMARIFGGSQSEADTTRVVGTYGYMPPEYAMEGRFSEKSDVFSFGVLLLEIITGKRTRWFDESSFSLLVYVWKQWNEDDHISLIDPVIAYQGFEAEISKCIHVGLLCVQEYPQDRPDMSDVIAKLSASSTAEFEKPKQPGFTRLMHAKNSSTQSHQTSSTNELSITNISAR